MQHLLLPLGNIKTGDVHPFLFFMSIQKLRFLFFDFKNEPQNPCQKFWTLQNDDFHNNLPFPNNYLKKNSIASPSAIRVIDARKSRNSTEQNIDRKIMQPKPIAIIQGIFLGLPPPHFRNISITRQTIRYFEPLLIVHYTLVGKRV